MILNIESHCISIVKTKILFSISLICLLTLPLSQLSPTSLSFKFLPLPLLSPKPTLATIAQQCQAQVASRCFTLMWVWFAPISVSWVKWWHGFGFVVASGFRSWRLVSFSMEIGGFFNGDRWVWIGGDWWVSGFGLVLCVWIGAACGFRSVLWVWVGVVVERCCGFGSVLLWLCLVIVVVGGGFWKFFVFLFLLVVVSCGCCWWRVWLWWCLLASGIVVARWPFSCGCSCYRWGLGLFTVEREKQGRKEEREN